MWNRQREAAAAREKLEQVDDEVAAPNRNPPTLDDGASESPDGEGRLAPPIERADAAE
jgi:ATP-binding cassette subfamily B protein